PFHCPTASAQLLPSLHDALPISITLDYFFRLTFPRSKWWVIGQANRLLAEVGPTSVSMRLRWPIVGFWGGVFIGIIAMLVLWLIDRKSTRLNSSHVKISYAVFCL